MRSSCLESAAAVRKGGAAPLSLSLPLCVKAWYRSLRLCQTSVGLLLLKVNSWSRLNESVNLPAAAQSARRDHQPHRVLAERSWFERRQSEKSSLFTHLICLIKFQIASFLIRRKSSQKKGFIHFLLNMLIIALLITTVSATRTSVPRLRLTYKGNHVTPWCSLPLILLWQVESIYSFACETRNTYPRFPRRLWSL